MSFCIVFRDRIGRKCRIAEKAEGVSGVERWFERHCLYS